jgi:hypothetical protein
MPKHAQIMPKACRKHAENMPKTCQNHAENILRGGLDTEDAKAKSKDKS